jgi:hypothetical protein
MLLVIMLLIASMLSETTGAARPNPASAGASGTGSAAGVVMSAGTVVTATYSAHMPVLSADEMDSIRQREAKSHRSGDIAESAVPAVRARMEPEIAPPSAADFAAQGQPHQVVVPNAFASDDLAVFRDTAVNSSSTTYKASNVMEPSTGAGGMRIFQTGNWYAARSLNGGATFTYLNPYSIFNDTVVTDFCCNQVTLYDPSRDTQFWLLQYGNGLKLALSRNSFTSWCYYNITPATIGEPNTTKLDYNDLAIGANYVYITSNYFPAAGGSYAYILRLPIDSLLACGEWAGAYIKRADSFTFKLVQGATDIMYWASNWTNLARGTTMRLFSWPENSGNYAWYNKTGLPAWAFFTRNSGQNCGSLSGTAVKNWCQFSDSRILGGALLKGKPVSELVWSFNAKQDANHPFPYTRIFRFREDNKAYLGQAELWATWGAWQFASLSPNTRGDLAINAAFGGQSLGGAVYYPGSAVTIQDDYTPAQPWQTHYYVLGEGNTCTYNGLYRWGDYLTVRPNYPAGYTWIATGYAIKGAHCGAAGWYSQWHNIAFGRGRDQNSYYRWANK